MSFKTSQIEFFGFQIRELNLPLGGSGLFSKYLVFVYVLYCIIAF